MSKKNKINAQEFKNSLSSVIQSLGSPYGLMTTGFGSTQVSQVDTFFKNNRWYLISNIRQILSEIYVEHGIVQTLVDVPVDDAFRGGIDIKSDQLSEEEVQDLVQFADRQGVLKNFIQAQKWMRLFGGSAVLLINDDDPATPLEPKDLEQDSEMYFKAVDQWELYYGLKSEGYQEGDWLAKEPEFFNYYGHKVHKSRVIPMVGKIAPSLIRPKLRGWGVSVLETVIRSYNQYLKSVNLSFEVLDEFKVDVFKIDGLNNALMSPGGSDKVMRRIEMANLQKNYQDSIAMDAKDDYSSKQLTFSGLAEVMREIRMQIAADLRMPLTKLFGISASGFNSGEDDIENYNAMIESEIRSKVKYDLIRVLEVCCQIKFGHIPDDLKVEFKPLRILTAEQEETVKNQKLQRILSCQQAGFMTAKEAKQAINKENLLPVKIDESDELIQQTDVSMQEADVPEIRLKTTPRQNSKSLWDRLFRK